MKISLNTIKFVNQHYGSAGDPAPNGVDALTTRIGAQLGAIEEVIDYGAKYEDILIVKVVSCVDHPNADRLHVCKVDDGGKAQNVERDEQGHVQVICGAPNVYEGMLAAWLPPGSTVPSTIGKDPFILEARDIRGQKSNGMMASPRELAIGDSHEGILEVDKEVAPGTTFAAAYNLVGEVVIDIENKMFTHRPDCFGSLGIARELEGIQRRPYKSPAWYTLVPEFPDVETEPLPLTVKNELPSVVPRFMAITMRDVVVKPSPVWLQILLTEVGMRPINNIVDYTNFFMLETGQPLHAYDYDKVKAQDADADQATITVRYPKAGEKIQLLNGKEIEPRTEAIMIASRDKLIGVGGVMGGGDTEVDEHTKNIIIEVATFDMYSIRRTSMAHGLFTDAVTRFNKGQSPLQNGAVLAKIVDEIRQFAGGKVASAVIDDNHLGTEVMSRGSVHPPVAVTSAFVNVRLGLELSADEIMQLLQNVEFDVQQRGDDLVITAPFWRTDIEIPEDIVEEVGRLYGYDHLPLDLPKRDLTPAPEDRFLALKSKVRDVLSKAGANEVLTYSFVHSNLLDKVGQDKTHAFQIANALSPDLQYYRLSLMPNLLEKVHPNIKAGHDGFALFEFGRTHYKGEMDTDEPQVPNEDDHLACVVAFADKKQPLGAAYYYGRMYLSQVIALEQYALTPLASFDLAKDAWGSQLVAPYEPTRSAVIVKDDQIWGVVGEFKQAVHKALKLPAFMAGFEVHLDMLAGQRLQYRPLPRFPKVEQDICLKVATTTSYADLFAFVQAKLTEATEAHMLTTLSPVDIYQREDDSDHKQITLRLSVANYERTLTDAEVSVLLATVAAAAKEHLGAERI